MSALDPQRSQRWRKTPNPTDTPNMNELGDRTKDRKGTKPLVFDASESRKFFRKPPSTGTKRTTTWQSLLATVVGSSLLFPVFFNAIPDAIAQTNVRRIVDGLRVGMTRSDVRLAVVAYGGTLFEPRHGAYEGGVLSSGCLPDACARVPAYGATDIAASYDDDFSLPCRNQLVLDLAFDRNTNRATRWTVSRRQSCP